MGKGGNAETRTVVDMVGGEQGLGYETDVASSEIGGKRLTTTRANNV